MNPCGQMRKEFFGGMDFKMKPKIDMNRCELLGSAAAPSIAFAVVPRRVLGALRTQCCDQRTGTLLMKADVQRLIHNRKGNRS